MTLLYVFQSTPLDAVKAKAQEALDLLSYKDRSECSNGIPLLSSDEVTAIWRGAVPEQPENVRCWAAEALKNITEQPK